MNLSITMSSGPVTILFFMMMVSELVLFMLCCYMFIGYLYRAKGYVISEVAENYPPLNTIIAILIGYYIFHTVIIIVSIFFFSEVMRLFLFFMILSCGINAFFYFHYLYDTQILEKLHI